MMRTASPPALTGTAVLTLLALGLALSGLSCGRQPAGVSGGGPRLAQYVGRSFGDASAPIPVEAILPVNNGCQDALGVYLADIATKYPALVRVRIYDMKSEEGRALMAAKGIKCASVLVRDTTQFDLGGDLGKVLLEGPMDPLDVQRVLQHEVDAVATSPVTLPDPPEDCSAPSAEARRKAGF